MAAELSKRWLALYALPVLLVVPAWVGWLAPALEARSDRLLLAPMMNLVPCLVPTTTAYPAASEADVQACRQRDSAAGWVHETLAPFAPRDEQAHEWTLGYTLKIPLLHMLRLENGRWQPDGVALDRVVNTLAEADRPAIVYLFSTHFSVGAPAEVALASQPENLAQTPAGPLALDRYYGHTVYPWSVARTDNTLTRLRAEVIEALAERVCTRPEAFKHIRGLTLLGEVHHLFPAFESGMGFSGRYAITDYSQASREGFRAFLKTRFGRLDALRKATGGSWQRFEQVEPPGLVPVGQGINDAVDHLDAFAAGRFPVTGWVYGRGEPVPLKVHIKLNGRWVATTRADLSRQDVLAARPDIGTADVGWRHDLDFRDWAPGRHRLDVWVEKASGESYWLTSRTVKVSQPDGHVPDVDHALGTETAHPLSPSAGLEGYGGEPTEGVVLRYNPLARLWLEFRQQQVLEYLLHFSGVLERSCLSNVPRYTHQIVPQFNPDWDFSKYAVDRSLQPRAEWTAGLSLYGGTSYGPHFRDWLVQQGHRAYAITEFHPLRAMTVSQLQALVRRHHADGARFLSFFLDTRHEGRRLTEPNPFSLEPDNPQFSSDALAKAWRAGLTSGDPISTRATKEGL